MHVKKRVADSTSKYVLGIFDVFKVAFDNIKWNGINQRLDEIVCYEIGIWKSY